MQKIAAFAHESGLPLVTYQTVMHLYREYGAMLHLLAWSNAHVLWVGGQEREYAAIVRRLSGMGQLRRRAVLGDVLADELPEDPLGLGVLNQLAAKLGPHLMPAAGHVDAHGDGTLAGRARRWAAGVLAGSR